MWGCFLPPAFVNAAIEQEYQRWLHQLPDHDEYAGQATVGIAEVLKAHFLLLDYFAISGEGYGGIGPRSMHLLHSTCHRQFASFGHVRKWESSFEVAATLFYGLIMNHPFHDCNKRTALLVVLHHLQKLGRCPSGRQRDFERLALQTAEHRLPMSGGYRKFVGTPDAEVRCIAHFLRRQTREIDKRPYIITYNELQGLLSGFGFALRNPHDNKIDVCREIRARLLRRTGYQRVITIGFPSWMSEVPKGEVKRLRNACGLTHRNGFDSQVFFRGVEPMASLIKEFKGPLERLADK